MPETAPRKGPGTALLLAVRLAVGGFMIYLGILKVTEPTEFLKAIHTYGMIPEEPPLLLNFSAVWIPAIEILGGLALILGVALRGAAVALGGMLAVFTAAVLVRGLQVQADEGRSFCEVAFDCGCGMGEVNLCMKLLENGALILGCVWIALSRIKNQRAPSRVGFNRR